MVRLTDRPDMTLMFAGDVKQQCNNSNCAYYKFGVGEISQDCFKDFSWYTTEIRLKLTKYQSQNVERR